VVVALLCGILGAVALGAEAGARRTESAYGRYLRSINASDVMVNIPSPDTKLIRKVAALPGVRSSAAWVGLAANPVVHGQVDDSFVTDSLAGSLNGELFTQDTMTVVKGRLPPLGATDQIVLTAGVARLFGVGVGGDVTYQFENNGPELPTPTGYATYKVAAIVVLPPVLVDQFDQVSGAVLPPTATAVAARHLNSLVFSWVGLRLAGGSAGIPAFQASLARLEARVGGGYTFQVRQLDSVHQQVQEAIRPQAVALGIFGAFAALALLVLAVQGLTQLLDRSGPEVGVLRALGLTRAEAATASALGGSVAVVGGTAVAIAGAVALSTLAPIGPVRTFDPARGFQFDATVLLGGGLLMAAVLLGLLAWLAWRSVSRDNEVANPRPSVIGQALVSTGLPVVVALGASYALGPAPGRRRTAVRTSVVGSVVAVAAVVTAVVFGSSLNGLVTHPSRYGWNWDVLVQSQGGYGSFLPDSVDAKTLGDGDGVIDQLMASQPGVRGWSTFGYTQVPIDGQLVPVLGLATHGGAVEPPTVSGHPLTGTQAVELVGHPLRGPSQIEVGSITLHQLGKRVGDRVFVGTGPTARWLTIVGTVTLPSIGVMLSDHVSLGRGAMLAESTLLAIEDFGAVSPNAAEAYSALPSTLAIDLDPGTPAGPVVHRIVAADPGEVPGALYQVPRVLGAAIVNAGQMGDQPLALAVALAVAVLVSLAATVVASARRRRRELAVLKSLGLTRRQMTGVLAWHTVTLLVLALALGLPIGIAAGHWAWAAFAASLGVVPVTVVPVLGLVLGLIALLAGGVALTAGPAAIAARVPPAFALRNE
jgi:ABC-type lipoprotein release transport system permease subunit